MPILSLHQTQIKCGSQAHSEIPWLKCSEHLLLFFLYFFLFFKPLVSQDPKGFGKNYYYCILLFFSAHYHKAADFVPYYCYYYYYYYYYSCYNQRLYITYYATLEFAWDFLDGRTYACTQKLINRKMMIVPQMTIPHCIHSGKSHPVYNVRADNIITRKNCACQIHSNNTTICSTVYSQHAISLLLPSCC